MPPGEPGDFSSQCGTQRNVVIGAGINISPGKNTVAHNVAQSVRDVVYPVG